MGNVMGNEERTLSFSRPSLTGLFERGITWLVLRRGVLPALEVVPGAEEDWGRVSMGPVGDAIVMCLSFWYWSRRLG